MRLFIICLLIINSQICSAQQKLFTYEQLFKGSVTNVTKPLPIINGWVDDDHYLEMRTSDGDKVRQQLYAVEVKSGKAIPYVEKKSENKNTTSIASLGLSKDARNITFSPDGNYAAYTLNNNLYIIEGASLKQVALTTDGSDVILNGYASWVYFEEILGRASRYKAYWWSPDSKMIAYMRFDDSRVPVYPIYVAEGQHGYLENEHYPKSGDKNPEVKVGITSIENPVTIWTDFNSGDDQYFGEPFWTKENRLWIQWMNRGQDNLKLYEINTADGKKKEIYDEKQQTWIDLDDASRVYFLSNKKSFILKSDKDGWENLYHFDLSGKFLNQITNGNFWGTSIVRVDENLKTIFFRARKENSARFDFYRIGLDGKGLTRLTFGEFSHDHVNLSPGGKYFITTYSNVSTTPAMALVDNKGKVIRKLGNIKGKEYDNYAKPKTEILRVKSGDGLFELPVLITYPLNFDPAKKYPVLVSIYGGPNAGTVYDRFRIPAGNLQWWAQEGIIQIAFDNRSSGHFGKKGLNYIHRQLGKWEIEDYITCARWLRKQNWVDTTRFAITGGSFGGYLTCMALTYGAEVFTHGVANSAVTDWHLYDTHYTERFMDTPGENPEGYKNTSVMSYAEKYKGLLRIVHGTSDDNVHMQNSIQLISKLQDLNKHFEFMIYPGERHGIGANSASKALHNRTESFKFLYKELLNKPLPAVFRAPAQKGF